MKKKIQTLAKKVVSFVLAFFLIFNFAGNMKARAITGVDDALVFGIIAKLMIAAGVSSTYLDNWVNWQDEFMEDCTDVYNEIVGETNDGIGGEDSIVFNPFSMIYGYRIQISDGWWSAVRSWVGSHFEEGEAVVTETNYIDPVESSELYAFWHAQTTLYSKYPLVTNYPFLKIVNSVGDVCIFVCGESTQQPLYRIKVNCWVNGSEVSGSGSQMFAYIRFQEQTSTTVTLASYDGYGYTYWFQNWSIAEIYTGSETLTYTEYTGAEGIIGNDEWDYLNSLTGDRVINIPLDKDEAGDLVIGNIGFGVDDDTLSDQVIDYDYSDIVAENQDIAGVTMVDETAITTDTTITDTSTGILQGVRESMLSLADTFPALFNAINNLGTSLVLLIGNLPNLYLWVPADTRGYIMAALSIAVLAVVYKIIRG